MKNLIKIFLIVIILNLFGCLEDKSVPIVSFELDTAAKILKYIESTGDFANSVEAPALIFAEEVYENSEQLFVLDIRLQSEFVAGHILNSINVSPVRLFEVVDSLFTLKPENKIVLVSKNGQASAYFVSLLRLAGFTNTYSLKYGMAYWNIDFADEWLNALKNDEALSSYVNDGSPKLAVSNLPVLNVPPQLKSDREITIYRIKEVIKNGFKSNINYAENFSSEVKSKHLKICYGYRTLYESVPLVGGVGHAEGTIMYYDNARFELRSTNSLQTLPADQPILIYSGDGQLSACVAAYLTVLGYNVKSLLFGANQLFYSFMTTGRLLDDKFKPEEINNYPIVTGN
jgi:rhodanese-related sulfurtransferase